MVSCYRPKSSKLKQAGSQSFKQLEETDPLQIPHWTPLALFPAHSDPPKAGGAAVVVGWGSNPEFEIIQPKRGLAEPEGLLPPGVPVAPRRAGPDSGELGSAPTLVLGSGSEQQPRAASSVRPPDAGCGSAMAALLYRGRRSPGTPQPPSLGRPRSSLYRRRRDGTTGWAAAEFQPIAARRASWLSADWVPVSQRLRPQRSTPKTTIPKVPCV